MKTVNCNVCGNAIQVALKCQAVCCPNCNNAIQIAEVPAPAMTAYHTPSTDGVVTLASIGRVFGILGFILPFVAGAGLALSIIAIARASHGDEYACSIARAGIIISGIALGVSTFVWSMVCCL